MTTTIPVPLDETAVSDASDVQAAVATSATKLTKPLRRTAIGISALLTSLVAINSGGMGVLIPDLVSKLDAANKVTNLAIVATVAFVVTIIAAGSAAARRGSCSGHWWPVGSPSDSRSPHPRSR